MNISWTFSLSADFFAPASAMVQNDSGLLVTKATLGLLEFLLTGGQQSQGQRGRQETQDAERFHDSTRSSLGTTMGKRSTGRRSP